jgi:cytoskeletal protein CcmA (bactofilin family)
MFSKADKTKVATPATRAAPSLISTDLEITGNINTAGEVQLDGTVVGDITCGKLVIGEKASITGHIEANDVVIRGRITGQVRAGSVQLAKSARVSGDIWHDTLAIEAGAFLDGHCRRNDASPASATAPRTKSEAAPNTPVPATAAAAVPAAVPAAAAKVQAEPPRNPGPVTTRQNPVQGAAGNTIAKTASGNQRS